MKYFMNIAVYCNTPKHISKFIYGLFDFDAGNDSLTSCIEHIVSSYFDLDEIGVTLEDLTIELKAFNNVTIPTPEEPTNE